MHRWIPGILILSLTACMRPGAPSVPMPSTSFARTATPPMTSPPLGTSADRTMPSVPTSTPRPPTRTPAPTPTRTLIPPPPATPPAPWPNGFGTDPDWFSAFFPTIDPNTKWWHAQVLGEHRPEIPRNHMVDQRPAMDRPLPGPGAGTPLGLEGQGSGGLLHMESRV